jgi:hypothetical protein
LERGDSSAVGRGRAGQDNKLEKLLHLVGDLFELYDDARTYLLTYLLTPWSRVLLEKLTGLQLVKKFPAFYGTRMFITALTSARYLSLS